MTSLILVVAALVALGRAACTQDSDCQKNDARVGKCVNNKCECYTGFVGENCEINACHAVVDVRYLADLEKGIENDYRFIYCNGHGECVLDPTENTYSCACDRSLAFTGEYCDSWDGCSSEASCNGNPCNLATKKCECYEGIDGIDCNIHTCVADEDGVDFAMLGVLCGAHGSCVPYTGNALFTQVCSCREGFSGPWCEDFVCTSQMGGTFNDDTISCKNGGLCIIPENSATGRSCECHRNCAENPRGCSEYTKFFTGLDCGLNPCGIVLDDEGNLVSQCNGHGTCYESFVLGAPARCDCGDSGYVGYACEIPGCKMDPNLCQHGGTCNEITGICECPDYWQGWDCSFCNMGYSIVGDICAPSGCLFGGVVCSGHGECNAISSDLGYCKCDPGYTLYGEKRNQCVPQSCIYKGPNEFGETDTVCNSAGYCYNDKCVCIKGFEGEFCEINSCGSVPDYRFQEVTITGLHEYIPCHGGGRCIRKLQDGELHWGCACRDHFSGDGCETFYCSDSKACSGHGFCKQTDEGSWCECQEGYEGMDCSLNPCNKVMDDYGLSTSVCSDAGTCDFTPGFFPGTVYTLRCHCRTGFSGEYCEVFDCIHNPGACNGGICQVDSSGRHSCTSCPTYMGGKDCDVDNCGVKATGVPCNGHGTCTATLSGYYCVCDQGWVGQNCENSECRLEGQSGGVNPIECVHGTCSPPRTIGDWTGKNNYCACDTMHVGVACDRCGPNMIEIAQYENELHQYFFDVCAHVDCLNSMGVPCSAHGQCGMDTIGVFKCTCDEDFVAIGTSECYHKNCVHTYQDQTFLCGVMGTCEYTIPNETTAGGWGCVCSEYARYNENNFCFPKDCFASDTDGLVCSGHGMCYMNALNRAYECECEDGYTLKTGTTNVCVKVSEGGSLSSGAVAAISVVVVVCVLAVVGVLVWYFISKRRLVSKYAKMNADRVGMSESNAPSTM